MTNVELAVESEAAFGLLGAAARAVMPHLQKVLAEKTTLDLKPFLGECAENDRDRDFGFAEERGRRAGDGGNHQPRLADIAYDSKTLRVIAEAAGTINVTVAALPGL